MPSATLKEKNNEKSIGLGSYFFTEEMPASQTTK